MSLCLSVSSMLYVRTLYLIAPLIFSIWLSASPHADLFCCLLALSQLEGGPLFLSGFHLRQIAITFFSFSLIVLSPSLSFSCIRFCTLVLCILFICSLSCLLVHMMFILTQVHSNTHTPCSFCPYCVFRHLTCMVSLREITLPTFVCDESTYEGWATPISMIPKLQKITLQTPQRPSNECLTQLSKSKTLRELCYDAPCGHVTYVLFKDGMF